MLSNQNRINLNINNRKRAETSQNTWRFNNILLNNTEVNGDYRDILKYFELDENENIIYWNMWDILNAVLRGKFIALNAYMRKSKIILLSFHLQKLEKKSKLNLK